MGPIDGRTTYVKSAFIPEYEFPGVSAALDGFNRYFFSTFTMSAKSKKAETIGKLNTLAESYEKWINSTLLGNARMGNPDFKEKIGNKVIERCQDALKRIREGISIIENDDTSFEAFCFMNRVIFLQNSIKGYAKKHGTGTECNFQDFINPKNPDNNFGWRPFQIAFILMNLAGIVDPKHKDREVVDLLYFPTGGGKTEAYLGLMAFVIANRRLRASDGEEYNRDGGATVMLRYTLRLLTTQQRDRITKMVLAAEMIRRQAYPQFGKEPISIGFWVGGGVTPNKFDEFIEKADNPQAARSARNHVYKQLLTCPFCGKPLKEENFNIDTNKKSIEIFCSDRDCQFYRYKNDRMPIPVYLVDEEIYAKCPTIILSTVDKFARLPWDVNTNALFGRVDRKCSRDGYVAIGAEHGRHNKTASLPASTMVNIRPFLPPELIIQDELHLISGALGTVVGIYETAVDGICGQKGVYSKIIASTATIRRAKEQCSVLYNREVVQSEAPGLDAEDSFFARESTIDYEKGIYGRKYIGIMPSGKTKAMTEIRMMAALMQKTYTMHLPYEIKDKFWTLTVYFNSLKDLGKASTLVDDDVKDFIIRTANRMFTTKRLIVRADELTSRVSTTELNETLDKLEKIEYSKENMEAKQYASSVLLATNMISVGIDVARLNVMLMVGQPKLTSEYIQASSRVGRSFPGLCFIQYDATKSRDRSHYERFRSYHESFYRFVEPTGATPFSKPARERALHAVLTAMIRQREEWKDDKDAQKFDMGNLEKSISEIQEFILSRIKSINARSENQLKDDIEDVRSEMQEFFEKWQELVEECNQDGGKIPIYFGRRFMVSPPNSEERRLLRQYNSAGRDTAVDTLTSMRNVDAPVTGSVVIWEE